MARYFFDFWEVERSPQRLLNALENERGFAAWYLRLRRLLQSSSAVRQDYGGPGEKLIHLWLQDCTRRDCHYKRIGLPTFPVRAKQPPHEPDRATVIQRLLQRTDGC